MTDYDTKAATMTDLEGRVLNAIAYHEFNTTNGATPTEVDHVFTYCWVDDFAGYANITMDQCKGVLSSLIKKGCITIYPDGEDTTVRFTVGGFEIWKRLDDGVNGYRS